MKILLNQAKIRNRSPFRMLLTLIIISSVSLLFAGELPSGESVLDKYIETTGGLDAFEKINNRVTKGTFELVNMGVKADITVYSQAPNKVHTILKSDVLGEIQSGISDDTVWELSVMKGPVIKEGQEKENAIREATFDKFVYWQNVYKTADCIAIDTVENVECYKIVLTPESGYPNTIYINTETNLITKVETILENQMGQIPLELFISDYRKVDNLLLAHKVTVKVMGQERIVTTDSIKQNIVIPDSIFKLPGEVAELKASLNTAEK